MLTFSVLVDDDVHLPSCLPERGLALLLECDGLRVLFDSGRGRALCHNAAVMGIDLASLTHVVLSHGHYDHVGGVGSLPVYPTPIPLIACRECWSGSRWQPEACSPTARPSRCGSRSVWCS
nr:MBL fold metallo-hydrolase [Aeromonas dhakensis]